MTAEEFLAATDLDVLANARESLLDEDIEPLNDAIEHWANEQAVANVLMYPSVLGTDEAVTALLRGLADESHYLRLAAAVGIGDLDPARLDERQRAELVDALLDLIASDGGPAAARATVSVAAVARAQDTPELVPLLAHPVQQVRRNLEIVLLELLGPSGLRTLLGDRGRVSDEDAVEAAQAFDADGVDRHQTVDNQRLLTGLTYIPSLAEWTAPAEG